MISSLSPTATPTRGDGDQCEDVSPVPASVVDRPPTRQPTAPRALPGTEAGVTREAGSRPREPPDAVAKYWRTIALIAGDSQCGFIHYSFRPTRAGQPHGAPASSHSSEV